MPRVPTDQEVIEEQARSGLSWSRLAEHFGRELPAGAAQLINRKQLNAAELQSDRLRVLHVDGVVSDADLTWLPDLGRLTALKLTGVGSSLRSFAGLERLSALKALAVVPATGRLRVNSLDPLRSLQSLEVLVIASLWPDDHSLLPLRELHRLRLLVCAAAFPRSSLDKLASALPALKCSWFDPQVWAALGGPNR